MSAVIEFDNVTKLFAGTRRTAEVRAVDDVSLSVEKGSVVGVIGYSGAGKSTLVRLINGLEKHSAGTVNVLGVDVGTASEAVLRGLRARIGMIFQQFNLFNSRTVRGNVAYPLRVAGRSRHEADARVDELLEFVGLSDKADQYPRRLSGGQKQRVGIARALATNPELLLADEATSALDPQTTSEVLDLLRRINEQFGITIVVITHQISIVQELCDQVVVMEGGRVADGGETYRVFAQPGSDLTRRFVASVTQGVPRGTTLEALRAGGGELVSVEVNEFTSEDAVAVFERHGVRSAMVYGGVTDVRGKNLGTITYRLSTSRETAAAIVAELGERTNAELLGAAGGDVDAPVATAAEEDQR